VIKFDWQGDEAILRELDHYYLFLQQGIRAVAAVIAPMMENYAKTNAPWTDRTANARQSLHAFTDEVAATIVDVYLAHGMEYGIWLEVRFQGRYAILWPTIEAHLTEITLWLVRIFGDVR
jgi:hypothetical protein